MVPQTKTLTELLQGLLSEHRALTALSKYQYALAFCNAITQRSAQLTDMLAAFEFNDVVITVRGECAAIANLNHDLFYGLSMFNLADEVSADPEQGWLRYRLRHVRNSEGAEQFHVGLQFGFHPLGPSPSWRKAA